MDSKSLVQQKNQIGSTKITDLDDDCLRHIFEYIDLRALCNVAGSNERLRNAVRLVYVQRFTTKTVIIEIYNNFRIKMFNTMSFTETVCWITIQDLKTCLQYLRCFGSLITKLQIGYYQPNAHHVNLVEQYIHKYCNETLISITFIHKMKFTDDLFQKPFTNVENVRISHPELNIQLPTIAEWFPNVRTMELNAGRVCYLFGGTMFQHLKHLVIKINSRFVNELCMRNIASFVQMNPQLQSFSITASLSTATILHIIRNNPWISKLIIPTHHYCINANSDELKQLVREHRSIEDLDLTRFQITIDDAVTIIRQLSCLQRFRFILVNHEGFDHLMVQLSPKWQSYISHGWFDEIRSIITLKRQN